MRLGFIGLGVMGTPMTQNLLRAGHDVAVYARRRAQAEPVVQAGAVVCDAPAEVARRAEVVFSMVTAGADVAEVALGEAGVIHGAAPGCVFVDMSTIAPGTARQIAAQLGVRGIPMLDAPVSGGEAGARDATLSIMVGGEAAVLERVRPLFSAWAAPWCTWAATRRPGGQGLQPDAAGEPDPGGRRGPSPGAGLRRGLRAGAPGCAGGSAGSKALELFGARMARRDFAAGVQARLHHKDYGILMNEAAALGLPLPVAAVVWQQLNALMALGWGADDTASLLRVLEREGS